MALPEGVTTCTYIAGPAGTAAGTPAKVSVSWVPVFGGNVNRIIYEPTGWVMGNFAETVPEDEDGIVSFDLPHVDQDGFVTPGGEAITLWGYTVTVTVATPNPNRRTITYTQTVQPLVGQDNVDLDLVSDGSTVEPLVLPPTFVTSINGQTGAVTSLGQTGPLYDSLLPKASPSGDLAWVTTGTGWATGLPLSPRSVGIDGWVYGSYNNTQMWRSGDALASRDLSAHVFTGKQVMWVSRVGEGYCALVVNAPSPAVGNGELWFSTDWETGWTKRQDIGPTRVLSAPRPRRSPHGTVLLVSEYDNHVGSVVALNLWLSTDGGQTWRVIKQTTPVSQEYNAHWHNADFDAKRQRIWAVSGDGPNSFTGYSDDYGDTWVSSPFNTGHPLMSTVPNSPHNKSTMLLIMDDVIHMCPDHGSWATGIWTMDADLGTPSTVVRQEVPVADPPSGALQWAVGSFVAQRGKEAYVSFPPNGSDKTEAYIMGTGDWGRSWHLVSTIALGAGTGQVGIIGPDLHGYLYFKGYSTTAFGDLIARAAVPTWEWEN